MGDQTQELQQQVLDARDSATSLRIVGSGSKDFYGRLSGESLLSVQQHSGVIEYEPTELVITVRAGTRLQDIEQILAEQNQMLAFEPPFLGADATIGGTVACGFSGPRRPFAGSLRDAVLGCKLLNGRGEILDFGGTVMKNVAGYDVSRLMAGSLGCLGVLLEISLRVMPRQAAEKTLSLELGEALAIEKMSQWCGRDLPLSALGYWDGRLFARLSGAEKTVEAALQNLGGDVLDTAQSSELWQALREHQLDFFRPSGNLWRISLMPSAPPLDERCLLDWGGAQRWLISDRDPETLFELARDYEGHATLWRTTDAGAERFQPLPKAHLTLQQRLKAAFDPDRLFNRGRMYSEL